MLEGIREDLSDPVVIAEVECRLRDVVRQHNAARKPITGSASRR